MICANGGCMSKVPGDELQNLIYKAKLMSNADRIDSVSNDLDDCAIITTANQNIFFTTDFGPPVVNDLFISGKIAALNAISDIYAMGGKPKYALAILSLGNDLVSREKEQLLSGLYTACRDERVAVVGGHTIRGKDTTVGLSVIGETICDRVLQKKNAVVNDIIMISKPLGTGIALRGFTLGLLSEKYYHEAIRIMSISNNISDIIVSSDLTHSMTDVTGFGLIGHLSEMLDVNNGAIIYLDKIPIIRDLENVAANVFATDYIMSNFRYAQDKHRINARFNSIRELCLFDPQTNGPIMISVDERFVPSAEKLGFVKIGFVTSGNEIVVRSE